MTEYLNLIIRGLSSSIPYAILGSIVGLICIVILNKKQYLKRENLLLKILTKLYFILFPIAFFFLFWFSGSLLYTKNKVTQSVDEVLEEIRINTHPSLASYIGGQITVYLKNDKLPSNDDIINNFLQTEDLSVFSGIYNYTMKFSLGIVLQYTLGEGAEREANLRTFSVKSAATLFESGFFTIKELIHQQINRFATPFFIPVFFAFFFVMLVPFLEIIISNRFAKQTVNENESA